MKRIIMTLALLPLSSFAMRPDRTHFFASIRDDATQIDASFVANSANSMGCFGVEQKEEHVVGAIRLTRDGEEQMDINVNIHSKDIVIDRENVDFLNWGSNVAVRDSLDVCGKCETYCALVMRLSRNGQAYRHRTNIYHLNKKVGTKFPMMNPRGMDVYDYTVMCSLLKMENNVADIEYSVMLEKSAEKTNKMTIPMNGDDCANLKFDNDICPVTLELAVTRQNQ